MKMRLTTRQRRRDRGLLDDVPRCSRCDGPNDRLPQRYCVACHRVYNRNWNAALHMKRSVPNGGALP